MSKYLKLFETTSQYEAYINGSDVVLPNVSVTEDAPTTVYYKPWVETRVVAKFNVTSTSSVITILNSSQTSLFDEIEIDGVVQPSVVSSYKFSTTGEHTVKYTFKDNTSIGNTAFYQCYFTSITIPDSVTSIGQYAFRDCSLLTSVTIGNGVTSIGDMAFSECSSLKSITIPNSVTSIGNYVFKSCKGLTSITIPDSVTSLGNYVFQGCTSLTSIVVDSNNLTYDSRNNCNAIIEKTTNKLTVGCKNTVIPNSVTSIGDGAFYNCSGLISVTIPNSVTSIGNWAFTGCTGLTSITCNATTAPTIKTNTFNNVNTGGTLTVPTGSTGYNVWMGTGNYYLGKYGWTKVEQ